MSAPLILIIAGEPKSTVTALHGACAAARAQNGRISIAQLVPVGNPVLLGDPHAYWSLTSEQQRCLDDCVEVAEDYGVPAMAYAMQMVEYRAALIELVEMLKPQTAYVPAPKRGPGWWRRWGQARLEAAFARRGCALVWTGAGERGRAAQPAGLPLSEPVV